MVRLREVIEVPRPVDEAFAYVADFGNASEWDPSILESEKVGNQPVGVGTEFRLLGEYNGRRLPMRYVISALEPPRLVVLQGDGKTFAAVDEITFEPSGDGTRVTYVADIRLKGLLRLAEPLLGGAFDRMGKAAVEGMRQRLDG